MGGSKESESLSRTFSKSSQSGIPSTAEHDASKSWQRHKVEYKEILKMKKLFDLDGLPRVLETMRRHLHSPDVQGAGCTVLSEVASNDAYLRDLMQKKGAIQTVLKAMQLNLGNAWQQETGCDFLTVIGTTDAGVTVITEAGGVDAVIVAMRVHSAYDGALRAACNVLHNIARHGTDKKAIVVDDGGVVIIVKAMRAHLSSSSLIAAACGALGALAWKNAESKNAVAKAGGIEAIVSGIKMQKSSPDVQENACKALRSIMGNSTEHRNRIARAGGIEAVVAGVAEHKKCVAVAREGSLLLQSLAAGHPQHQQAIAQAGGISIMAEGLRDHPYVSPQTVGGALLHLSGKDEKIGLCETDFAFHKPSNPRPLTRSKSENGIESGRTRPSSATVPCCVTEITVPTPTQRPQSATVVTRTASASSLRRPVHDGSQRPFSAGHQRFVVTNVSGPLGRNECQLLSDTAGSRPVPKKQRPVSAPGKPRWATWKMRTFDCNDLRRKTFYKSESTTEKTWQLGAHRNEVVTKTEDKRTSKMEFEQVPIGDLTANPQALSMRRTLRKSVSFAKAALAMSGGSFAKMEKLEDA
eukprot:gnl/MRDRNA2_/MRDRNA2_142660_c0_seq1.p1 gnl/MRDRNA2_/MRDRNA2_142660_c0~~gnl/MRDRNA2_/MRDRNA2_142660_c0_seq1.p1  ORF type:complete len:582 (-),score=107.99 gnl/MRDRNA2_/MRDRNA2_142660_c0_seq1:122-1867(-)